MELFEAIKNRRSVRKYKVTPVDDKTLGRVLDAARWAPSWTNSQCWRFVVVRDGNLKVQLAETLLAGTRATNPARDAVQNAPVVIVACAEVGKVGYQRGSAEPATNKGEYWYMFDVALAMQNLTLAAHALGLGTVHVGMFDAPRVAAILEVPPGFRVVEIMPLGYSEGEPKATTRKELSEFVFYDKFAPGEILLR